ncbi:MAG: hypothetical protein K2K68_04670, partial [Duncaniella sp.]|nr:hypothetical protein [Duncaniella sp.]
NTDDFESFFTEENTNYTQQITTSDGWYISYCSIKDIGENFAPTLSGNTASPGTIVSPVIRGGISALSFYYMCYYSDKTVDITVNIRKNDEISQSFRVFRSPVIQKEPYLFSQENIDIDGEFTIEFVNNCPSGLDKFNIDRVSVWNISWDNYEDTEKEITQDYSVIYRDYDIGEPIEFDNPDGVDILYCINGDPDYRNIYEEPSLLSDNLPDYTEGVTYNHTTHPLIYTGRPISARYVSYQNGKLPSGIKSFVYGSSGLEPIPVDKDLPEEYFDMNGNRLSRPVTPGIYIMRMGTEVFKIRK